jgi:hypothetical protein
VDIVNTELQAKLSEKYLDDPTHAACMETRIHKHFG